MGAGAPGFMVPPRAFPLLATARACIAATVSKSCRCTLKIALGADSPTAKKPDLPGEYAFGTYRLVRQPNRLLQGDEPIPLAQRALMVLTVLVEHAGEIVSRDELFDAVWRDRVFEPGNLDVQLSLLRRLLGRELIQTVPGRGYRIAVSVTVGGAPLVVPSRQTASQLTPPERTNLPRYVTPLIGRDEELADLAEQVTQQRLTTIAGAGGVGKTRLAIAAGRQRTDDFPDDVWLIDLAPLSDPALIASATATVLGVALHNIETPVEAIIAAIDNKRLLLIFDNCEYLVASAAELIKTLLDRVGGYTKALSTVVSNLGSLAAKEGDAAAARRCFNRALDLSRASKDSRRAGYCLLYLAEFEFKIGAVAAAVERARQAVGAFRSIHHRLLLATVLGNFAAYLLGRDDLAEARASAEEALSLVTEHTGKVVLERVEF
jgi:DNA-binding winged helix-turn-helix (wHTH) protein